MTFQSHVSLVRGPLLSPQADGSVAYFADGALLADADGRIEFAGPWEALRPQLGSRAGEAVPSAGVILPPFLDVHTHVSQFPIRGHFTEGVPGEQPGSRLIAGLERNVFPEEARDADAEYAKSVTRAFAEDALTHGVVGGASYMTVHPQAVRAALEALPDTWAVGLVLMNQQCPPYLRTDEASLDADVRRLAEEFGTQLIVTDRFAVSVSSPLRRRGAALSLLHGLRMQTHLNEQRAEKTLVEQTLYPGYASYTDVYRADGLLDRRPLLAHCIQMRPSEWEILQGHDIAIAHCPTSNTLLGSGIMPLNEVVQRCRPYALGTDVGASPTTSLLAEMAQFLKVHAGRSAYATPSEALFRTTLAPAQILGLDNRLGSFAPGMPLSYVEVAPTRPLKKDDTAEDVIRNMLGDPSAAGLEEAMTRLKAEGLGEGDDLTRLTADVQDTAARLETAVQSVTLGGRVVWRRQ